MISLFKGELGEYTESYYTSIEFNSSATKGYAVHKYITENGIKFSYSLGNSLNDESMFLKTNIAFKMKDSPKGLTAVEIPFGPNDDFLRHIF